MSFTANQVTSLTVKGKDGSVKGVLQGKVIIKGGDGFKLETDGNEITLNAGADYNEPESRFQRKFEVIINGGTFIDDDGTPYVFKGMPYYVAKIGGVGGDFLNNFDFLSNACGQVGIFTPIEPGELDSSSSLSDDQSSVSNSESESSGLIVKDPYTSLLDEEGRLPLLDICQACIDCEDYAQIVTLMERIEEFQDIDVKRNLDGGAGQGGELALFRQFQAIMHFWNYLAHDKCFPLVPIKGNKRAFVLKSGYINRGLGPHTATQVFTLNIGWANTVGEVYIDITDVKKTKENPELDDPVMDVNKISDTEYELTVTYPELEYDQKIVYEAVLCTDEPMSDADVSVEWQDTHVPSMIKEEENLV